MSVVDPFIFLEHALKEGLGRADGEVPYFKCTVTEDLKTG